jgi:hypothetical protein
MDFLLECIGFGPDKEPEELHEIVRREGEPVAWRGPHGEHLKLKLALDLELRMDQEEGDSVVSLLPYFNERARLRISVQAARQVEDSPFDALLTGWVAPPTRDMPNPGGKPGAYALATWLTDARRLPKSMVKGHVLAVSVAGFAVLVRSLQPAKADYQPEYQDLPRGAYIRPLAGIENPGGCSDVSARILEVRHTINRITGRPIDIVTIDAPERPLKLFVSPWQLEQDGLPAPRPGYRIEGTFMFIGRITGGLPGPRRHAKRNFG